MGAVEIDSMRNKWWRSSVIAFSALYLAAPVPYADDAGEGAGPDPAAILQAAASHLAATPGFSVSIRAGYDAVQESGQKIEFNELRRVVLQRPAKLRVDVEESNGNRSLVVFDGRELTTFEHSQNVYAKAPIAGDVDAAIRHFVGELHMRLPLAMLLTTTLPAELERRVQSLEYVEETNILGVPCDHLAARTAEVDFQVWIARGETPLIQRVVITYKNEPASPQFRAQFSDWNFSPGVSDQQFVFNPPADATRIQFLAQLLRTATAAPAAPAGSGDQP
jgi:hypothetical protein